MQRARPWDVPIVQDAITRLPAGLGEQTIVRANGHYSNYDVWFSGPNTWLNVPFRLELQTLEGVTVPSRKLLSDIENPVVVPLAAGIDPPAPFGVGVAGRISGILMSVHGHAAIKAKLIATRLPQGELAEATFFIRAWGIDGTPAGRNTRPQTDPFAGRDQYLAPFAADIPAGVTTVFAASPTQGRTYITSISHTTDDGAIRTVLLQTRNPTTAAVTVRHRYLIGGAVGSIYVPALLLPLRSDRGDVWEVSLSGDAGVHDLNVTGFID